jgi:hypothetical protein
MNMELPATSSDLTGLLLYLLGRNLVGQECASLEAVHSLRQDKFNLKSPRAFCHVMPGDWAIYCSRRIEDLPGRNRVGLLLHEIGHLEIHGFKSLDDEVDVDEWILKSVPEARYQYETVSYLVGDQADPRVAQNLQTVGEDFYERIGSGRSARSLER